ncbi:HNH endonuclease [Vibrio rotiferianus]|uniref:HNH endonuclease n=1 Tax=Vibrio rotiferianus TaxID=190895 RepID=UPI0009E53490
MKGNHSQTKSGDFGKADASAPKGTADYVRNTWHHHEDGVTMQEVPKAIHAEFTHRGGVSNFRKKTKECPYF